MILRGGGGWPNCHATFAMAESLFYSSSCSIYGQWGKGLAENIIVYGGRGWLKTSEYRNMVGGDLKLLKKTLYDI